MVAVEKKQAVTIQNANEPVRNASKLSELRSAVPNLSVQQASFSQSGNLDTFVTVKASIQKEV